MTPLISIVLPVKNGLPHLRKAIDGIRRQTYRNFEVVVQDGASTDGSLEYLHSIQDLPNFDVISAPDSGIGQAFNRCVSRSRGDFVCAASADEVLEPNALDLGVRWFTRFPDAVSINGAVRLSDEQSNVLHVFQTPHFDLLGHLQNEIILPFAGFLNRRRIGNDLRSDESLRTCPDYDLWIRLGMRFDAADFVAMPEVFKTARADAASMSFRPEAFDQFCRDKLLVLNRFLDAQPPSPLVEVMRKSATAGIYIWAAESVHQLEGVSASFFKYSAAAARLTPFSSRLRGLSVATAAFVVDEVTGEMVVTRRQPDSPTRNTRQASAISLSRINKEPHWGSRYGQQGSGVEIVTAPSAWAYAARVPFEQASDPTLWQWVKITLQVDGGAVGIGLLAGDDLLSERLVRECTQPTDVFLPITKPSDTVLVRNAHLAQRSTVRLLGASLEVCEMDPEK